MPKIYIPASSPDDWKRLLAKPEKHWRTGYSARAIANCWQTADDFPCEIAALFSSSGIGALNHVELLLAIPEHQVPLPPYGGHPSQNDLFALGKASDGSLVSITVEGKASEDFDKTIGQWMNPPTPGKTERLAFLQQKLGFVHTIPPETRYQLLHRLVSAVLEAERFNAKFAVMVVHSFSQKDEWFGDFQAFLSLFGANAQVGRLAHLTDRGGISVYSGWAQGDVRFLSA